MIVIGLGSGRTGTASLAGLIGSQHAAICFHELNPTGAVFTDNPQPLLNAVHEFQAILQGGDRRLLSLDYSRPPSVATYRELQRLPAIRLIGDIAYYYLRYVDDILAVTDAVRFVCIKRDKEATIASWIRKAAIHRWPSLWIADRFKALITRTPFYTSRNFWQDHDGSVYQLDPVWDKTFPKFPASSMSEAIGRYWDYYYAECDRLNARHPREFRIFPITAMSGPQGQTEILRFLGISEQDMVLRDTYHLHQSPGSE